MKKLKLMSLIAGTVFVLVSCDNKSTTPEQTTTPASETTAAETTYTISTDSTSVIKWKGVMVGIKEHLGTINFKSGSVTLKDGKIVGGNFTADMASITPTDKNYDEKAGYGKDKLKAHLSSADFFDVANHPTATFTIKSVNGSEATGTFAVRGKSNEETVKNIVLSEGNGTLKATGVLVFDRKKYDVNFEMAMKNMVVSKDIELTLELTGTK